MVSAHMHNQLKSKIFADQPVESAAKFKHYIDNPQLKHTSGILAMG